MSKVSIIIPSRNEIFLQKTVIDLLQKGSDIEIIAVLEGYWPDPPLVEDKRLIILHRGKATGMRNAINSAAAIASGEWLMKTDAHCLFIEGYDEIMKSSCDHDWIMIPSRYSLDYENWGIANTGRARVDYHYLSCPLTNKDGFSMHGQVWTERARERLNKPEYMIDDEISFQGSCWFMHKDHFNNFLGGMSTVGYGSFTQEAQEIGIKTWLGGGRVVVNKNAYYAHLHKGKTFGRGYSMNKGENVAGGNWSAAYWTSNLWKKRVHNFDWLIDKFWPMPTWPNNWQTLLEQRQEEIHGYLRGIYE